MSDFVASSNGVNIESGGDNDWLASLRAKGSSAWGAFPFPTRKTEDWKYTNLTSLKKRDVFSKPAQTVQLDTLETIPGIHGSRLVFVNGAYSADLSQLNAQSGVSVVRFSEANAAQQSLLDAKLNSVVDIEKHGFAALNTKCLSDGVFIHVDKNTNISEPVSIVNYLVGEQEDVAINSRILVLAEANSSATIIEHFLSDDAEQKCFENAVTELLVGENAQLEYYQLLEQEQHCNHIGAVHAKLEKHARLNSFYLALGTLLTRVDVTVTYTGEGAEADINGVYLPLGKQHVDFHTCIEHAVPHCQTNEVFRGIVADEARAVFNGRIHIHPDAQKTEAYLSNKNLLTSNKAEVDTKPELEIYADDVRCAHGATVAQLEPLSVHYLKTRGISEEEAMVMLSFGFINELLEGVKLEEVAFYCRPKLASRFARDTSLIRHLG